MTLTVGNAAGVDPDSTTTKSFTVVAPIPMCTVPDFKNLQTDVAPSIQTRWQTAGFVTDRDFQPITASRVQDHAAVAAEGLPATMCRYGDYRV